MSCGITNPYMNRRAEKGERYEPTFHEHVANTLSHGIAILPSIYVTKMMIDSSYRDLQFHISCIYGFFTTLLFVMSTLYHLSDMMYRPSHRKLRYYLHITDRISIYFFIAASATPWLTLRNSAYISTHLKWIVWLFAIFGIAYQLKFHERYKSVETLLYIINACVPYIVIISMGDRRGLWLMLIGGAVYGVGVVFFKLDGVVPFAHAIWHCHVLVGAAIHTYVIHVTLLGPDDLNPFSGVKFEV